MLFLASNLEFINITDTAIVALVGYAMVFVGLIALMLVVTVMGKIFIAKSKKNVSKQAEETPVIIPEAPKPVAPGAAGELKLHDVEPKTAAMLMAIVADKMGKPLNELRFISIKEVK